MLKLHTSAVNRRDSRVYSKCTSVDTVIELRSYLECSRLRLDLLCDRLHTQLLIGRTALKSAWLAHAQLADTPLEQSFRTISDIRASTKLMNRDVGGADAHQHHHPL